MPANAETVQYYEKADQRNIKYVTVFLNGIPVEMIFDTGASAVVVNSETFRRLGIQKVMEKATAHTAGGIVDQYVFEVQSVKIGNIEARNVVATYVPTSDINLLGGTFLNNFKYLIDDKNKIITFFPREKEISLPENSGPSKRNVIDKKRADAPANGKQPESSLYFKVREPGKD